MDKYSVRDIFKIEDQLYILLCTVIDTNSRAHLNFFNLNTLNWFSNREIIIPKRDINPTNIPKEYIEKSIGNNKFEWYGSTKSLKVDINYSKINLKYFKQNKSFNLRH